MTITADAKVENHNWSRANGKRKKMKNSLSIVKVEL
jgi:hypothetical protein